MSLLVITTGHSLSIGERMMHSAKVHGLNVLPYAIGPLGSPHGGDIQGTWVLSTLRERTEDYILSADLPDVLFLAGEEEILKKYRSFNSGMVVSAEGNCITPVANIPEELDKYPGRHKYVNIGLWIGERQHVIDTMQKSMDLYRHKPLEAHFDLDSPGAWFMYGILQKTMINDFALDRDSVLFQSTNGWSRADIEVKDNRIYNHVTGTWPIAVHYNGTAGDVRPYGPFIDMSMQLYGV